jgi:uncharacterized peroxidase-related enzyme
MPSRVIEDESEQAEVWIEKVPPKDATGTLAQAYDRQRKGLGFVSAFTQLSSLYPDLTAVRLELYKVVDNCPSQLPELAKHAVALTTCILNETPHCASGMVNKLRRVGADEALVNAIYRDPLHASTGDAAIDALLVYTRKLVTSPGAMTAADVDELRRHGWGDLEILDANNISAYYCYINRVANGLGLKTVVTDVPEMVTASVG